MLRAWMARPHFASVDHCLGPSAWLLSWAAECLSGDCKSADGVRPLPGRQHLLYGAIIKAQTLEEAGRACGRRETCSRAVRQVVPVAAATMSSLYPSLEDMTVDRTLQAQANAATGALATVAEQSGPAEGTAPPTLYPNLTALGDYMGLSLSSEEVQKDLALVPPSGNEGALLPSSNGVLVAPLTGNDLGLRRAEIRPGVREIQLCKDERGKTGVHLKSIDQGVFVQLVKANSPAALVGLRFGDQVLQINGKNCAGWSTDKAHRALKKAAPEKIVMVVRDRPFQRTVTMHKDSTGHVGFVIKKGKIVSLVKGGSAARNGLLINQYLCEVNGQNVIGLKDKQILDILTTAGNAITITVIPAVIYEHMVKRLSPGLMKSSMDHSLPDV
uniref:Syndecan binding protein 2 n=1 Tax=Pelusios castaneus TaxID=367368 RepID=A0A8C8R6B1_9SAUR